MPAEPTREISYPNVQPLAQDFVIAAQVPHPVRYYSTTPI